MVMTKVVNLVTKNLCRDQMTEIERRFKLVGLKDKTKLATLRHAGELLAFLADQLDSGRP